MASSRSARLWAKGDGKVNQGEPLMRPLGRPKLPLPGTRETSWPMNNRDRKPPFRRGGGKGPDQGPDRAPGKGRDFGRRPGRRDRDANPDGPVILYGWHTVV